MEPGMISTVVVWIGLTMLGQANEPSQPGTPPAAPSTPAATPAAQPGAMLAEPPPLKELYKRTIPDKNIGTALGAYLTSLEISKKVEELLPQKAADVRSRREEFVTMLGGGYQGLLDLICQRSGQAREQAEAGINKAIAGGVQKITGEITVQSAGDMLVTGRLEPKTLGGAPLSMLLSFSPGQMSDGEWLMQNGWSRGDVVEAAGAEQKTQPISITIPMSWARTKAKPGESTWSENGGMGPASVAIYARPVSPDKPFDPITTASAMATAMSGAMVEGKAITVSGKPAGEVMFLQSKMVGDRPFKSNARLVVFESGGTMAMVNLTVASTAKAGEREYTDEELDAYAKARAGLMQRVLESIVIGEKPKSAKP